MHHFSQAGRGAPVPRWKSSPSTWKSQKLHFQKLFCGSQLARGLSWMLKNCSSLTRPLAKAVVAVLESCLRDQSQGGRQGARCGNTDHKRLDARAQDQAQGQEAKTNSKNETLGL